MKITAFLIAFQFTINIAFAQPETDLQWTFMGGDSCLPYYGVYGIQGIASTTTKPGSRNESVSWTDNAGNFWLFGGYGFSEKTLGFLGDLWKYDPSANQWTWIKGAKTKSSLPWHGIKGAANINNDPGCRLSSISWVDHNGLFWLFGGSSLDATGLRGDYNDLWKYDPPTNQWTWMKGDTIANSPGQFGTKGIPSAANNPRARHESVSWTDKDGNLWLFGGASFDPLNPLSNLNDLWKYDPLTNEWTWMKGDNSTGVAGIYGTKGTPSPNNNPGCRVGSVSWTDNAGNLWLFGGETDPAAGTGQYNNDLWKYNPSINQWTWMKGDNTTNAGSIYGIMGLEAAATKPGGSSEGISWTDNSGNLWMLVGSSSDLFKYNIVTNNWTWVRGDNSNTTSIYGIKGIPSPANSPGFTASAVSWKDGSGNFWLFGGSLLTTAFSNELWKYDPAVNQWAWINGDKYYPVPEPVYGVKGVASANNKPPAREEAVTWKDAAGNLWLFGGHGLTYRNNLTVDGVFNDLWKYSVVNKQWTWVNGDSTVNVKGIYGTKRNAAATNKPGARKAGISWTDASGNLWLFGGQEYYDGFFNWHGFNDLWKYDPLTNLWTWVKGDSIQNLAGIYGQKGIAATTNKPGARYNSISWSDNAGNLWLFGGYGYTDSLDEFSKVNGYLNDLWKYNIATNLWTWISGSTKNVNQNITGVKGIPGVDNIPGGRQSAVSWTDKNGSLWLFGGTGNGSPEDIGPLLNDLWRYNPSTNEWTWMKGSSASGSAGSYGIKGIAAISNEPAARTESICWTDFYGNLWLFGGYGLLGPTIPGGGGYLNNLWKYDIAGNQWTWMKGDSAINSFGSFGAIGTASAVYKPGSRMSGASWADDQHNLWLLGGYGFGVTEDPRLLNDLWKINIGGDATPLILINIAASVLQKNTLITWQTAQEINAKKFIIEHSADGVNFTELGAVSAAGNSSFTRYYSFIDPSPLPGTNYYRLKMVDINGQYNYSGTCLVKYIAKSRIYIKPNPVRNELYLALPYTGYFSEGDVTPIIHIYSADLQLVKTISIPNAEDNDIRIPVDKLPAGTYFLQMINGRESNTIKFIKE